MNPKEFLEQVTAVNVQESIADIASLRLAINAIMTLDAFFGVLHAALQDQGELAGIADDLWKEQIATEKPEYRPLRDAAYALKHGKLDGRKPRLVKRPDQVAVHSGAFDSAAFDSSAFDTDSIWIECNDGKEIRLEAMLNGVVDLARSRLIQHGFL